MSTLPECIKCGNYIHSGFVVCDTCNDELPTIRTELTQLRAENAALTDKLARMTNEVLKIKAHLSDGGAYTISRADNGNMFIGEDLMWSEIFNNLDALLPAPDSQQQE